MIRAMMYNSGDVSKDTERVVGYGSWFLYPDTKNDFIEKFYSKYVMDSAKKALQAAVNGETFVPEHIPTVLTEFGASFITLKLNNELRGCIGSIYPTKPLILDIIDNAINAGLHDSRFEPVAERELEHMQFSVSILSSLEKIEFKDEKDLLSKIYPYGIIITDRDYRAVYLPEVWEQLPDKEVFFNSLKEKAGLPFDYFSRSLEVYKFNTLKLVD